MTFEEEFPELKDKTGCMTKLSCEYGSCDCKEQQEEFLMKYCLSKQRVKEIIEQYAYEGPEYPQRMITVEKHFLKELGLEE